MDSDGLSLDSLIFGSMGWAESYATGPNGTPITHSRYTDQGILGRGGGGEVRRVFDPVLKRDVAMKLLHPDSVQRPEVMERFFAEARICARLSHPAIIAIYDWGVLEDGRPFMVMPIVIGQTLSGVIQSAHSDGLPDLNVLKRLVSIVRTACEAIAYAHTRSVVHRDLKPGNIMVGHFGEVIVLDWGLASFQGETLHVSKGTGDLMAPISLSVTRVGEVKGSLGYMAPEQARGDTAAIDEQTDVFALGAVLYEVLSARPPWGMDPQQALADARAGRHPRLGRPRALPRALVDICERALHPDPEQRPPGAADLARTIGDWADGLDDLLQARALVRHADAALSEARSRRSQARQHEVWAEQLLEGVAANADESEKLQGWQQQDEAHRLRQEADFLQFQHIQNLQTALSYAPQLVGAHRRLAQHYHGLHREATDAFEARRLEALLRQHDRGEFADYLKGTGQLSLTTSRPATVRLSVYAPHRRRLHADPIGPEQPTPLLLRELPIGSYLAEIRTADGIEVCRPLSITRCVHTEASVWIPEAIPEGMVYVPAGPYWCGGDAQAFGTPLPLQRVWVDGFFISRFPVTNADYIAFLDDLVDRGLEQAALACAPRERGRKGTMVYGRTDSGHFQLVPDHDGDLWHPRWPVVMLSFFAMQAYAAWKTEQTGLEYRLPYELEWEKAARGSADSRAHVWGTDAFDPSWCRVALSTGAGRSAPAPVDDYAVDVSPYGVRGLAGNVTDICLDHYHREGPIIRDGKWRVREEPTGLRPVRGGQWAGHPGKARLCWRGGAEESALSALNGFRLVVPTPAPSSS